MSKPAELTRAEWTLMQALWQQGRASATELQKLLDTQQGWAYSTVKTMLDRMV
ncbi:MAG: BlaI/MecI/CopY family transcriptional regulator, partial [Pirellulaceae bacterium]|nr:BlaI/MecI/CopY family transcriptional regulator [Pirellulaceae bacterium]